MASSGSRAPAVNNLKNVSVAIPAGVLTVVTGVAGAGKSSLVQAALPASYPDTIIIDQNLARGLAKVEHRHLHRHSRQCA